MSGLKIKPEDEYDREEDEELERLDAEEELNFDEDVEDCWPPYEDDE